MILVFCLPILLLRHKKQNFFFSWNSLYLICCCLCCYCFHAIYQIFHQKLRDFFPWNTVFVIDTEAQSRFLLMDSLIFVRLSSSKFITLLLVSLHKKWSFSLRISSVNVTKSAVFYGFGHIYWWNPKWKISYFVQGLCCVVWYLFSVFIVFIFAFGRFFQEYSEAATRDILWEKVFLEISQIHRKTPVPEPLFDKVAGLRPATLLKKRLWHSCFPVNFAKFPRTFIYSTPLDGCF